MYVIAEDHRNLARMIRPEGEGGWGLDGVWADDFHHKVRVALAGDNEGYYRDYTGSMSNLAGTLNQGWHFTGQYSTHLQEHRGTDPTGIPPRRFVFCIQNHDQIGNRALGERLHHQIDLAAYRAASVLLLCAPATPLLFMGQEWAATTPFLYFTDHPEELGKLVTEGRRNEFRHFSAFSDAAARERIPDPQDQATFRASRLDWSELDRRAARLDPPPLPAIAGAPPARVGDSVRDIRGVRTDREHAVAAAGRRRRTVAPGDHSDEWLFGDSPGRPRISGGTGSVAVAAAVHDGGSTVRA